MSIEVIKSSVTYPERICFGFHAFANVRAALSSSEAFADAVSLAFSWRRQFWKKYFGSNESVLSFIANTIVTPTSFDDLHIADVKYLIFRNSNGHSIVITNTLPAQRTLLLDLGTLGRRI